MYKQEALYNTSSYIGIQQYIDSKCICNRGTIGRSNTVIRREGGRGMDTNQRGPSLSRQHVPDQTSRDLDTIKADIDRILYKLERIEYADGSYDSIRYPEGGRIDKNRN